MQLLKVCVRPTDTRFKVTQFPCFLFYTEQDSILDAFLCPCVHSNKEDSISSLSLYWITGGVPEQPANQELNL